MVSLVKEEVENSVKRVSMEQGVLVEEVDLVKEVVQLGEVDLGTWRPPCCGRFGARGTFGHSACDGVKCARCTRPFTRDDGIY